MHLDRIRKWKGFCKNRMLVETRDNGRPGRWQSSVLKRGEIPRRVHCPLND